MRLAGKVAFISGGARGLGEAHARLFAAEGAKIAIGDLLEDVGGTVVSDIRQSGGDAMFVKLDVTSESDWQDAIGATVSRFGKLNVLVNNAGVSEWGRIEDTTVEQWDRVFDINAKGVFLGTKTAIPELRRAGGGSIVNISSQMGIVGSEMSSAQYQSSKAAVRVLTKTTAIQYAKDGIRCNSVHPGPIVTAMTEPRRADPDVYARMLANIPMNRYGQPIEIAYGVLYLASDESSYVTGSELVLDGGWTAQ